MRSWIESFTPRIALSWHRGTQCEKTIRTCPMPDSLISNHTAYVASLRGCPSCPDRLSVLAGMRTRATWPLYRARLHWVREVRSPRHRIQDIRSDPIHRRVHGPVGPAEYHAGHPRLGGARRPRCGAAISRTHSRRRVLGVPRKTAGNAEGDLAAHRRGVREVPLPGTRPRTSDGTEPDDRT